MIERGPQGRRHRRAAQLPAVATRRPRTSPTTATPRSCYVDAEFAADVRAHPRRTSPRSSTILVFDGAPLDGMTDADDADRPPPPTEPTAHVAGDRRGRRDDDLHVGHDRQAEGRVAHAAPATRRRSRRCIAVHRLHARRRLHHDRPAVPLRSRRVHGHRAWRSARPSSSSASSTRRTGCASSTRTRSRRRSRAPTPIRMICNLPDEVKAKLRPRRRCGVMIANAAPWSFALKQHVPRATSRPSRCSRCTARPSSA